ncbi:MAG: ribosomal L7Ae/L30e/S12e/Gadd45 family protein [Alicyclobacillus sp.]|nr:ribosomal L7Ae/L30e/S12e/Gadd45 family protein [Alicyclobacillus sp.]
MARLWQLLGMAVRARRAVLGFDAVMNSIQTGRARLVFVADDVGLNSRKKYLDKCTHYRVPLAFVGHRAALGRACGREGAVAVSVLDEGFARTLSELVGEIYGGEAFGETSSL